MTPKSLLCALFSSGLVLCGALATAQAQSNEAVAPVPTGASWWVTESPPRTGWPTNGLIFAEAWLDRGFDASFTVEQALEFVTVDVLDPSGVAQTGTLGYDENRQLLIWTGDTPLMPSTTYAVTIAVDNMGLGAASGGGGGFGDQIVAFQVTTGSGPAAPAPELMRLGETLEATASSCCPDGVDTCHTAPQLEVALAFQGIAADVASYYPIDASADGAICASQNTTVICTWAEVADEYCYTIEVTSLFDDSTSRLQGCVADSAAEIDDSITVGCPSTQPGDGCSIAGVRGGRHGAPLPLTGLGLLLMGLSWRERSRSAHPPRTP